MTKSKGIKRPDWVWTDQQLKLLAELYPATMNVEIAKRIGCTEGQVLNRAKKVGLKKAHSMMLGSKHSAEHKQRISAGLRRAVAEGRWDPAVAGKTNISKATAAAAVIPPEVRARRDAAAAESMRGRPQCIESASGASEKNARAKTFTVIAPGGEWLTFTNLNHFVRTHPELFGPDDVEWKGPEKNPWCRASRGLSSLFRDTKPARQWKEWVAVRKSEAQGMTPSTSSDTSIIETQQGQDMNRELKIDTTVMDAKQKLSVARRLLAEDGWLAKFLPRGQRMVMLQNLKGEEGAHFVDTACELYEKIFAAPVTYGQDGKGDQAVAHFHYFRGSMDFYITELDMDGFTEQAFGLVNLGPGAELGYISIGVLIRNDIELDLHWTPKTIAEIERKG